MIQKIILKKIEGEENNRGVELNYLKYILKNSTKAFFSYMAFAKPSKFNAGLSRDAVAIVRLLTTKYEKVESCIEVERFTAKKSGLSDAQIDAILSEDRELIPSDSVLAFDFTRALITNDASTPVIREKFISQYSSLQLIEFSYLMATMRVYPTIKRVLGFS